MKSIIDSFGGSKDFKRMRIGIGHPGNSKLVNKYVVQKGSVAERNDRLNAIENGIEVIEFIVKDNWDLALNTLPLNNVF